MSVYKFFYQETPNTTFLAKPGIYKIECWGGQGSGHSSSISGKGGYVSGFIQIKTLTPLFIYLGGQGQNHADQPAYNGGGHSQFGGGKVGL